MYVNWGYFEDNLTKEVKIAILKSIKKHDPDLFYRFENGWLDWETLKGYLSVSNSDKFYLNYLKLHEKSIMIFDMEYQFIGRKEIELFFKYEII